ncbi:P1 family peptidase [Embleya sp. NBC_00896]|uniref:P1 family peptidase n=1 Tax=Embleya sp. NBC_00896 TaxID=2975961 RepID=UPI0038650F42|nr:P1 family peptidase [Embleya sp. NBC_00896]
MFDEYKVGPRNAITDVAGLRVGHAAYTDTGAMTGTTVLLGPVGGFVAGVDVRGGAPGTRELDALDPRNLVPRVEAIVLSGGSAFGLDAAGGVVAWLAEQGRGFPVGTEPHQVVPVVPAAALFDLGRGGDWWRRPDAALGREAVAAAAAEPEHAVVPVGSVGAGTGAMVGGIRGGLGTASVVLPGGVTVAALAVVNAAGSAVDPVGGLPYAAGLGLPGEFPLAPPAHAEHAAALARAAEAAQDPPSLNTTIGIVATDAVLTRAQAQKVAGVAHDGLARAIRPVHTLYDGDTIFAVSTARVPLPAHDHTTPYGVNAEAAALTLIHAAAADVFARAVVHGVLAAKRGGARPAYQDLYPNATARYGG